METADGSLLLTSLAPLHRINNTMTGKLHQEPPLSGSKYKTGLLDFCLVMILTRYFHSYCGNSRWRELGSDI